MSEKQLPAKFSPEQNRLPKQENPYRESELWLEALPGDEALLVRYFTDHIVEFSKGTYSEFFKNCGLYTVGGTTKPGKQERGTHKDIDIVLVGLDFRSVIDYDGVFLMDPKNLIEKGIVAFPNFFKILQQDENGNPTVMVPAGQTEEQEYGYHGIEYEGIKYDYNPYTFTTPAGCLEDHCLNSSYPTKLVKDLFESLNADGKIGYDKWRYPRYPFGNYCYGNGGDEYFVTVRSKISPRNTTTNRELKSYDSPPNIDQTPVDFNIHAENLLRSSWEDYHNAHRLPFICLYKWPEYESSARPILTQMPLPDFVDADGKERVKRSLHTHDLNDLPINIINPQTSC